jgi:hypothetical protein
MGRHNSLSFLFFYPIKNNDRMAFLRASGLPNIQPFVKTASTALDANGLVDLSSGQLVASTSSSLAPIGISLEKIASTDADYATARPVLVDEIDEEDLLLADVSNGSLLATSVGQYFKLADDLHVDFGTAATLSSGATGPAGILLCVGFISATQGYFRLSSRAANITDMPTS